MHWLDVSWAQEFLLLATCCTYHLVFTCDQGWFGSLCQHKCQCEGDMCDSQGRCEPGPCVAGFFGPGCQYVDLIHLWRTDPTPQFLYDGNETSCNPNPGAKTLSVGLQETFRFSWVRIVTRSFVKVLDFRLLLNSSEGLCRYERHFYVSNITVDITCDSTPLFSHLAILGDIAGEICAVYISGGRNVATKQAASQSSTQAGLTAGRAVDGLREDNVPLSWCSSTLPGSSSSQWTVKFSSPQLLLRVAVYGSTSPQHQLHSINLLTFKDDNIMLDAWNLTCQGGVCVTNTPSSVATGAVVVRAAGSSPLVLCEVEVYGETLCPDGLYGPDCAQPCSCSPRQICSLVTGTCSDGCTGFFGYECDQPCGQACVGSVCLQRSGDCVECHPGYMGRLCTDVCPEDKFGKNCMYDCSQMCLDRKCNRIDGICRKCEKGRVGPFCKELEDPEGDMLPYIAAVVGLVVLLLGYICFRRYKAEGIAQIGEGDFVQELKDDAAHLAALATRPLHRERQPSMKAETPNSTN